MDPIRETNLNLGPARLLGTQRNRQLGIGNLKGTSR